MPRARRGRPKKLDLPSASAATTPASLAFVLAATPSATPAIPPVPVVALTAEDMALTLEAHPDYRVLRRLVPTLDFGMPTGQPVVSAPPIRLRTLLVLDTETTGLDATRDKVIELALLRVTVDAGTGRPVGAVQVYDGLEDPGMPVPPHITDITGITTDMVRGQQLDEVRVAELLQGVDLVVAHNAGFDRPFVEARLPAFAHIPWACSWADVDWKALGQGSAKLESLALACGWFYDAHRAETDCHALLAVLAQPVACFASGTGHTAADAGAPGGLLGASPQAGELTADPAPQVPSPTVLNTLLDAAEQTHHKLQATGAPFDAKDVLKARGYRWDGTQRVWGTLLRSEAALAAELAWLAEAVYGGRSTRVRVESLTATQRYANRPGAPEMRLVEGGLLAG
ncbi:MAG: DNA polymerase III subunit epsilon [Burkholderiales bacterium]|nr:DNA polymerase III subunit epsilon [Burkholderiales bacterium]